MLKAAAIGCSACGNTGFFRPHNPNSLMHSAVLLVDRRRRLSIVRRVLHHLRRDSGVHTVRAAVALCLLGREAVGAGKAAAGGAMVVADLSEGGVLLVDRRRC